MTTISHDSAELVSRTRDGEGLQAGDVYRWDLPDWEPDHCHWRGPSWFVIRDDGTLEVGAAYLANMKRTDPIFDVGSPRNFWVEFELFDPAGSKVWYGTVTVSYQLYYKHEAHNTAVQVPGNFELADYVKRSSRATGRRTITEAIVGPGPTIPVITIPWPI